ncbi:hypothetical protein HZS61_011743 [Fusarium oxysporum f. sp. conglutinans]|uniref:Uncharacterized protein n=1 Tax=Fusarium oxysporum f. sp. conglutinans TaxID=100902 RepID=A0A8H6GR76_FUSOX|nr:hypothetical protein HZS61_011743 [Fusarium oxysporum f. sp. conglutinans]
MSQRRRRGPVEPDWATWQCGEEGAWTTTCKTIGSHFGCFQNIFTTCYPSASICDSTDQRALCCTADINGNTNYPYCATGIKPLGDGEELSIYLCGKTEQQVPFYESTVIPVTTGSTTGEQTLTIIDTTKGVIETETAEPSPGPGNPAPVGAIVGGVVGGCRADRHLGTGLLVPSTQEAAKQGGCDGACTCTCAYIPPSTTPTANGLPTRYASSGHLRLQQQQ